LIRTIVLTAHKVRFSIIVALRFPALFHTVHDAERYCCAYSSVKLNICLLLAWPLPFRLQPLHSARDGLEEKSICLEDTKIVGSIDIRVRPQEIEIRWQKP
jgi:hypothetical protein